MRAAGALVAAGHAVSELMPPELEQAAGLWGDLINEDVRRFWPAVEPATSAGARDFVATVLGLTDELDVADYAMRWQARQVLARQWSLHQAKTPLILAPICLRAPFAPGEDLRGAEAVGVIVDSMRFVVAVNALGLPSAAVPVGLDDSGMPLAVQIIGPRFREDLCLDAAAAIEEALGTLTPIDPRVP